MVTGGYTGSNILLDSTEVYQDNEWRTVAGKMPMPLASLRATTINNRVLVFGNNYQSIAFIFLNLKIF